MSRRWAAVVLGGLLGASGAHLRAQDNPGAVCSAVDRPALVDLGKELFSEAALSEKGTISCASCHLPQHGFADPRRFSRGQDGEEMPRHTPPLINRPRFGFQLWDGRALSLEAQVAFPLVNPKEMGRSQEDAAARVAKISRYRQGFRAAFGSDPVDPCRLRVAIAAFVASLRREDSDYERAASTGILAPAVARGKNLFAGKARCAICHSGPDFTDQRFHNTGIAWKARSGDLGRGALTGRAEDRRAFKTPTLRQLLQTAPYMHDGSLATLPEVLNHYLEGGAPADPAIDPVLKPLHLTPAERSDLLAFLRSLSDSSSHFRRSPVSFEGTTRGRERPSFDAGQ